MDDDIERFKEKLNNILDRQECYRLNHNQKANVVKDFKQILEFYKENNKYSEECQNNVVDAMEGYKIVLDNLLQDSIKLEEILKVLECKYEVKADYEVTNEQ